MALKKSVRLVSFSSAEDWDQYADRTWDAEFLASIAGETAFRIKVSVPANRRTDGDEYDPIPPEEGLAEAKRKMAEILLVLAIECHDWMSDRAKARLVMDPESPRSSDDAPDA